MTNPNLFSDYGRTRETARQVMAAARRLAGGKEPTAAQVKAARAALNVRY